MIYSCIWLPALTPATEDFKAQAEVQLAILVDAENFHWEEGPIPTTHYLQFESPVELTLAMLGSWEGAYGPYSLLPCATISR